jgi:hypothetical protein
MMPVSLNVTLMNHQALHSQILSAFNDEPEELKSCLKLAFQYPKLVWPYFANIRMTIETGESNECKTLEQRDIEIKVNFIVKNIESGSTDQIVNIE